MREPSSRSSDEMYESEEESDDAAAIVADDHGSRFAGRANQERLAIDRWGEGRLDFGVLIPGRVFIC